MLTPTTLGTAEVVAIPAASANSARMASARIAAGSARPAAMEDVRILRATLRTVAPAGAHARCSKSAVRAGASRSGAPTARTAEHAATPVAPARSALWVSAARILRPKDYHALRPALNATAGSASTVLLWVWRVRLQGARPAF